MPTLQEVKQAARGRWEAIFAALAPELLPAFGRRGQHGPCPIDGGEDGFRFYPDADQTGGAVKNCPYRSMADGFDVLQWIKGDPPLREVVDGAAEVLGYGLPAAEMMERRRQLRCAPAPRTREQDRARNWRWMKAAYLRARRLEQEEPGRDVLAAYLHYRGLAVDGAMEAIQMAPGRMEPLLRYKCKKSGEEGRYPGLLLPVRLPTGEWGTLHRSYFRHDGSGKADVSKPRRMMPNARPIAGGAIRLGGIPRNGVLRVAEGWESALAVMEMTGDGVPCWSAASAAMLGSLELPVHPQAEPVRRIEAWIDDDPAGFDAVQRLTERMGGRAEVVEVVALGGGDPLDALTRGRRRAA